MTTVEQQQVRDPPCPSWCGARADGCEGNHWTG